MDVIVELYSKITTEIYILTKRINRNTIEYEAFKPMRISRLLARWNTKLQLLISKSIDLLHIIKIIEKTEYCNDAVKYEHILELCKSYKVKNCDYKAINENFQRRLLNDNKQLSPTFNVNAVEFKPKCKLSITAKPFISIIDNESTTDNLSSILSSFLDILSDIIDDVDVGINQ